jgi:chromosomal replication initiation ATPase DnaA
VHGIGEDELYGRKRTQMMVFARHVLMHLMRKVLGMTLDEIAAHFGYHHTSIIHGIAACENEREMCDEYRDRYNEVLEMMGLSASRLFIEQ